MTLFKELDINPQILKAVEAMGFEEATPIQSEVIPKLKAGKDIIGQAQTGTGKTAAFGIPLIENMNKEEKAPQGLILAPTRELAIQVSEEINRLGKYAGIWSLAIYGGQDITRQIKALKRSPQIIVGTPGRFMDHMRRKTIRPNTMRMVVLDEADEMLSMGFVEDIETILSETPEDRQTLLFSATMPTRLKTVTNKFMKEPESIKVKSKGLTVSNIEQRYIEVPEKQKFDTLCHQLDITPPELAIVFGRTKRRVDELAEALTQRGYAAEGIHGDLKQEKRDKVIRKFKKSTIDILVATDVAARGLDVSGVTHVYNFDLPQDPESYVHRIGRTGRAGKNGLAYSFVTPKEKSHLKYIEDTTKAKMIREELPTFEDAREGRVHQAVEDLAKAAKEERLDSLKGPAENLLSEYDAVTLVAAALKMNTKEAEKATIKLTEEAPLRSKKQGGGGNYRKRNDGPRGGAGGKKPYGKSTQRKESYARTRRNPKRPTNS